MSGLFLSLNGNDLERFLNGIVEECDVNDNDVNLLNAEEVNVDQLIGTVFHVLFFESKTLIVVNSKNTQKEGSDTQCACHILL